MFRQVYSGLVYGTLSLTLIMYCYKKNVERNHKIIKILNKTTEEISNKITKFVLTINNKDVEINLKSKIIGINEYVPEPYYNPKITPLIKMHPNFKILYLPINGDDLDKLNFIKYSNEKYD
jgi:hypothetical protein